MNELEMTMHEKPRYAFVDYYNAPFWQKMPVFYCRCGKHLFPFNWESEKIYCFSCRDETAKREYAVLINPITGERWPPPKYAPMEHIDTTF